MHCFYHFEFEYSHLSLIGPIKNVEKKVADIIKEINEEEKSLKMLFNFNVNFDGFKEGAEEEKINNRSDISIMEEDDKFFKKDISKTIIMKKLFELIVHANNIIKITGEKEMFNSIEMSVNKKNVLLDKSKVIVVRMNSLILMIPIKIAKIEVKLRNTFFINEQPHISSLAMFIDFFLDTYKSKSK